jgi:molybdopterin-binding protein
MKLSAMNQLQGKVLSIKKGAVMAQVKIGIAGGAVVTALIGIESVKRLGLKKGDTAYAVIKSTSVIVGK